MVHKDLTLNWRLCFFFCIVKHSKSSTVGKVGRVGICQIQWVDCIDDLAMAPRNWVGGEIVQADKGRLAGFLQGLGDFNLGHQKVAWKNPVFVFLVENQ